MKTAQNHIVNSAIILYSFQSFSFLRKFFSTNKIRDGHGRNFDVTYIVILSFYAIASNQLSMTFISQHSIEMYLTSNYRLGLPSIKLGKAFERYLSF